MNRNTITKTANDLLIGTFGGTDAMPWLETFGGHKESPLTVSHFIIPGTHIDDPMNPTNAASASWAKYGRCGEHHIFSPGKIFAHTHGAENGICVYIDTEAKNLVEAPTRSIWMIP